MNRTAIVFAANGKPVNLRKQANADADILTRVPVGEKATVTGLDGNWATVEWNGLNGYMMRSFLHLLEEETSQKDGQADDVTAMLTLVLEKLDTLQQSVNKLLENATDLEGCK